MLTKVHFRGLCVKSLKYGIIEEKEEKKYNSQYSKKTKQKKQYPVEKPFVTQEFLKIYC